MPQFFRAVLSAPNKRDICACNGEHLYGLRPRGFIPDENTKLGYLTKPTWLSAFESLYQSVRKRPHRNEILWGTLALKIILQACPYSNKPIQQQEPDNLIGRALVAIRENSHRPITVANLAILNQTTQRTLERHFAQHHVRSPQQEIIHVRLERATRMLANPGIPIKEIAYTCDFGSPKLMNYNFQRVRNQTPGQQRKRSYERNCRLNKTGNTNLAGNAPVRFRPGKIDLNVFRL